MPTLRRYQRDLIERCRQELLQPGARVMLQLATGGGKTEIAGALISKRLLAAPGSSVVWLTHREELCHQTEHRLRENWGITVESPTDRWQMGTPAPLIPGGASILRAQTVARRIDAAHGIWQRFGRADLLVVDEAHHAPATGWEHAITHWPGRVIGLTATPWRLSRTSGFDHLFDKLIEGPQISALQRDAFLAYSQTFTPPPQDRIVGGAVADTGDFTQRGIEEANDHAVMTARAVAYWMELARERQTIAYAVSARHALNLVNRFVAGGIAAALILSATPADERTTVIEDFKAGRVMVIVNVAVATEGFDLPDASCIMITRPTRSLALYLQMVGRGLRPKADGDSCLIIDLAGNAESHGVPETHRRWSLSPRGDQMDGNAPVVRCPKCGFVSHPSCHQCPQCGDDMGQFCERCGRFRRWNQWSSMVCDRCIGDLRFETATTSTATIADERVLMALYQATNGPAWKCNRHWGTDRPLADWHGVTVSDVGRVTGLDLGDNGLAGTIPDLLGSLSYLTTLDLSRNRLSGAIPGTLGDLYNLSWLDLSSNEFTGEIPQTLGKLRELSWARFNDNRLEGGVPLELCNLAKLQALRVHGNNLDGGLPEEFKRPPNLKH